MSDLTPITRNEHLLNGDDLEPKNRKEMFLKRIYDKTQSVPEPETREEYFLKKAGDASGDITIEQLTVTENGEYSEQGVAYSPVIVNVPTPPSYLVKDVPNLPQAVASFDDAIVAPIIKLKADIEAVQSGSGDPYPPNGGSNKWDEVWADNITIGSYGGNFGSANYVPVTPEATYYIVTGSYNVASSGVRIAYYDENKDLISSSVSYSRTLTIPNGCNFIKFGLQRAIYGTTYNNDIAINYPATVTTYSPYSNICPISGWDGANVTVCGVNLWDEEWELGDYNITTGAKGLSTSRIRSTNYIPVSPNTTYMFVVENYHYVLEYDKNKNFIQSNTATAPNSTFTLTANTHFITFYIINKTTYANDLSINYPSTDTSYHAYNGNTYPISWQTECGTVYGGNFEIFKDGGKWYCTVAADKSFVIATSENTVRNSGTQYYVSITGVKNNAGASNLKSNKFKTYTSGSYSEANICFLNSNGTMRFNTASEYSSVSDMLTAIGEIQLVYPLATPTTTTFEISTEIATLLGNNNIFADCGDVEECRYITEII